MEYERAIAYEYCQCTEEDWECDFGFERQEDGPCIKSDGSAIDYNPPRSCSGKYEVSYGYRKVAGDMCTGGVDHSPLILPCPYFVIFGNNTFFNLVLICAIALLGYYAYHNSEEVKTWTDSSKEYVLNWI